MPCSANLERKPASIIEVSDLLCVDWVSPHGTWDDLLVFVYDGGTLTTLQIANLKFCDGELGAFAFCDRREAEHRLRPYVAPVGGCPRRAHHPRNRLPP
jgi:hypothetical protein